MKKIVFLIFLTISCICNINATEPTVDELLNNISSNKPSIESFSEYYFKPDTLQIPRESGDLLLEIEISPNFDCEFITVVFLDIYNLNFNSQKNMNIYTSKGETTSFYLDLNIPFEGKSGFSFNLNSDGSSIGVGGTYWFVSEKGKIVFFNGHPGVSIGATQTPTRSIGISDEEFLRRKAVQEKRKQMAREDTTRIWFIDTAKNWHFLDKDSLSQSREFVKKSEIKKMQELEKSPLTWATQQDISVDGKLYTRNKGEYKFRPLIPHYGPDADPSIKAREDSLDANRSDHLYHFVFDLRDSLNFQFVDSLIDNLLPMEIDGYYHGEIWKSMVRPIDDRKIRYKVYPEYPKDFNNIPSKKN